VDLKRILASPVLRRELIPDPRGIVGFALAAGVLFSHLALASTMVVETRRYLWSENTLLEVLGHAWFILGPPLSVYLGVRNLLVAGDSVLPLLSVPLGLFLSLTTLVGLALGCFI
jgi:hypothetical protein